MIYLFIVPFVSFVSHDVEYRVIYLRHFLQLLKGPAGSKGIITASGEVMFSQASVILFVGRVGNIGNITCIMAYVTW